MSLWELIALAVVLSMDAFAVSICKGLSMETVSNGKAAVVGLYFGLFQMGMPLLGYLLGSRFSVYISSFDHWIAFILLLIIGVNMIRESREAGESIDASLAVGVIALWMLRAPFAEIVAAVRQLAESSMDGGQTAAVVLRAAGITVLSELGVQVCCDSGESAMAGRIRLAARVILVGMALPIVGEIFESISSLLSLF